MTVILPTPPSHWLLYPSLSFASSSSFQHSSAYYSAHLSTPLSLASSPPYLPHLPRFNFGHAGVLHQGTWPITIVARNCCEVRCPSYPIW